MILSTSFATTTASPLAIAIGTGSPDAPPVFGALLGEAVGEASVTAGTAPAGSGLSPAPPSAVADRQADALSGTPLPPVPAQPPLAPTIAWRSSAAPVAVAAPRASLATSPIGLPTPKAIAKPISPFATRRASLAPSISAIVRDDAAEKMPVDSHSGKAGAGDTTEADPEQASAPPTSALAALIPPTAEPPPRIGMTPPSSTREADPPMAVDADTRALTSRRDAPALATSSTTDAAILVTPPTEVATLERRPSAAQTVAGAMPPAAGPTAKLRPAVGVTPRAAPAGLEAVAPPVTAQATASEPMAVIAADAPLLAATQPRIAPGDLAAAVPDRLVRASIALPSIAAADALGTVVAPAIRDSTIPMPQAQAARGDGRAAIAGSTVGAAAAPTAAAAAPPATALPITQGPAIRVFGAAIAAARRDERGTVDDRTVDPATLQPLADAAHPTVAATGSAQLVPLDLRQDRWPHAMIDRIAHLRDTAAAAAASAADTRIRLIPDALGTIDVSITREGDSVAVRFQAEHAGTRALLQDSQVRLADIAESRGLRLSGTSVDPGSAGPGQQQRAPQQQPTLPSAPRRAPISDSAAADDADAGRVA